MKNEDIFEILNKEVVYKIRLDEDGDPYDDLPVQNLGELLYYYYQHKGGLQSVLSIMHHHFKDDLQAINVCYHALLMEFIVCTEREMHKLKEFKKSIFSSPPRKIKIKKPKPKLTRILKRVASLLFWMIMGAAFSLWWIS